MVGIRLNETCAIWLRSKLSLIPLYLITWKKKKKRKNRPLTWLLSTWYDREPKHPPHCRNDFVDILWINKRFIASFARVRLVDYLCYSCCERIKPIQSYLSVRFVAQVRVNYKYVSVVLDGCGDRQTWQNGGVVTRFYAVVMHLFVVTRWCRKFV